MLMAKQLAVHRNEDTVLLWGINSSVVFHEPIHKFAVYKDACFVVRLSKIWTEVLW